jgi:hypothetical protein
MSITPCSKALCVGSRIEGRNHTLQSLIPGGHQQGDHKGQSRRKAHLHIIRRSSESDNAHATIHAIGQWLFKEGRELHAVALDYAYYNFAKIHKTLRVTPADLSIMSGRSKSSQNCYKIETETLPRRP